jgi:FkbM family methyltransferase
MSIEKTFISLVAQVFRKIRIRGMYRLAGKLYPFDSKKSKGFITIIPYLDNRFNLKIKIFSKGLIEHKVLFTGEYEDDTNIILKKYVHKNDVVIEAGANIGTETLLLSKLVGNNGMVYAFEPVPHIFTALKENCQLNKLENVRLEALAVGNENNDITFYIANRDLPNQGMGSKELSHSELKVQINVKQEMLDAYLDKMQVKKVDFIKMDIQGGEIDLLKGAVKTIVKHRPAMFLEAGEGLSSIDELFNWLTSHEYKVSFINRKGNLIGLTKDTIKAGNWLATYNHVN